MQQTQDLRVAGFVRLKPPCGIKQELPISERANETVVRGRAAVLDIHNQRDDRLLLAIGP